jgi:hypothetical protein
VKRCLSQPCTQQVWSGNVRCYYHKKVHAGLLEPVENVLSDVEINTLMGGRLHQDGRRLDHYVSDDGQP